MGPCRSGERIEVGLIGREGVAGIPVLPASDRTPPECFMQMGPSEVLRLEADRLRQFAGAVYGGREPNSRLIAAFGKS